ncbi:IS1380 family transposase [Agromyces sp. H66]|uniref:IS1380 family transposase n=1 Tax=Agromyces sp. H66 TaxID=2529859 RepID=UPI0010AA8E1A|nr:IS1380 family transposase [Agromyces sp. H66]
MQFKHAPAAVSVSFDDPNLVSAAGLVPVMRLAEQAGLRELANTWLSVPSDKGANAGLKVTSLVGGMVAGADSIDDMALLRHGGMRKLFTTLYAPSTLGSFLRAFTFGHVRQLDAVASRFLAGLSEAAPVLGDGADDGYVFVDVDDTIIEVHGHQKQGAGFGYSGVRGLNALLATVATTMSAPVVLAQRLRRGGAGSPRGAARLVRDSLATLRRLPGMKGGKVLLRADSAFYGHATVAAAIRAGAAVSVTVRMDPAVKRAIAAIPGDAWEAIEYTDAIYDEDAKRWVSAAEVAEVPFTAFTSRKKAEHIVGRLVVRRIPELNKKDLEHPTLFDTHRFHAFFTTSTLDTVTADKTHRGHAIIEQVNADLKNSALAHLPSGVFNANAAWLVLAVIAYNLTRAAASIAGAGLAKATTATIRRKVVTVPARIASSARRIILHLPDQWPWETAWTTLFDHVGGSPPPIATT